MSKTDQLTFNYYDELRVTERTPIFNQKSIYGVDPLRDITVGNVTTLNGEYVLACAGDGDEVILDTAERCPYASGQTGEPGAGFRMPSKPPVGVTVDFGMFGDSDGYFNRYTSEGLYAIVKRAGVENDPILLGYWGSGDKIYPIADPDNPFEPASGYIYQWPYTWYAYGPTEYHFQLFEPDPKTGKWLKTLGTTRPTGQTSTADPQQPVRIRVTSDAGADPFTVYVGGRQYSIVGPYDPIFRETTIEAEITGVNNTAWFPAITVRRASTTPYALTQLQSLFCRAAADMRVAIEFNTDVSGVTFETPALYADNDPVTTLLESAVNPSVTFGTGTFINLLPTEGGTPRDPGGSERARERLPLIENQAFTIYLRKYPGDSGDNDVNLTLTFREDY